MTSEKYAKEQIKRLSGLNFFPTEPAAVKELVTVISGAETERVASELICAVLDEFTECPKPAELRKFVYDRYERDHPEPNPETAWRDQNRGKPNYWCKDCRGWGTKGDPPNAVFCHCPNGEQVKHMPELGQKWLALVNRGKVSIDKLQTSTVR